MRAFDPEQSRGRLNVVRFGLLAWALVLAGRLVQLQVVRYDRIKAEVDEQNQNKREIPARRGTIFDRRGRILARSLPVQSVFLSPSAKDTPDIQKRVVGELAGILALSREERSKIAARIDKGDRFIWIKRKVDEAAARAVAELRLPGVFMQEETTRFYPQGRLAAHVLGFVDIDEKGRSGVESAFHGELAGRPGRSLILRDARRRAYHLEVLERAVPGRDLELTIDETIQYHARQALARSVALRGASWGTVIVAHPGTGEILALASIPDFDPRQTAHPAEQELNRAIAVQFDPGSTFKIVTAAAALENDVVRANERFDCSRGAVALAGNFVRDHKPLGLLSFADVFSQSSNVGMIQVGTRLSRDEFYDAVKAFGFGAKTGIELPGEINGTAHPPSSWAANDQAYQAIGYGLSVTALQILQAVNAVANDGVLVPPRIVRDADRPAAAGARTVLQTPVARRIKELMRRVVDSGTGHLAAIPGYPVAGKTGTTQKLDPALRRYTSLRHVASFAGFIDTRPAAFSVIVVLDDPSGDDYYGGQVAAPVFREIARQVLRHFRIPPAPVPAPVLTADLAAGGRR